MPETVLPPAQDRRAPTVSVVMPAHNSARFVEESVASVVAQTFGDWELIVVDDASADDTPAILARLAAADQRIRIERLEIQAGPGMARNHGMRLAAGRFLAFLDSDDLWTPDKLECQLEFMRQGDRAFTYTQYIKVGEDGQAGGAPIPMPPRSDYAATLKHCCMSTPTVMLDRERLGALEMPPLSRGEDHVLWLAALQRTPYAWLLPEPLVKVRVHAGSLSYNKLRKAAAQWRVYRETLGLGFWRALWCFAHYACHGLLKLRLPRPAG